MKSLRRVFEPKPKMVYVPGIMDGFLSRLLEADPELPRPDSIGGSDGEWMTEDEARRREEASRHVPSLEELLQDPNVRVVVEAAEGLRPVPSSCEQS